MWARRKALQAVRAASCTRVWDLNRFNENATPMNRQLHLALLPLAGPLAIGALGTLGASASHPAAGLHEVAPSPAITFKRTSVRILDSHLDPLAGVTAKLEDGSQSATYVTDALGQTPWASNLDSTLPLLLTLGETQANGGIALGKTELVLPVSAPAAGDDDFMVLVSRTQPLAVPVVVEYDDTSDEANHIAPPEEEDDLWSLHPIEFSALRFSCHVAPMLDYAMFESFMTYHGYQLDPSNDYVCGVNLVMPSIQLGTEASLGGFVVGINLLGAFDDGLDPFKVDAYNVAVTSNVPFGAPLAVELTHVEDGFAFVYVSGRVRGGHLSIVLRPDDGDVPLVVVTQSNPPDLTLPPNAGSSGTQVVYGELPAPDELTSSVEGVAGAALLAPELSGWQQQTGDCPPVEDAEPSDEWDCYTAPPAANNCGAPTPGTKQCKVNQWRTPTVCRSFGDQYQAQQVETKEHKVSFKLGAGGEGTPLQSEGGYTYGSSSTSITTETFTPDDNGPDPNLGECKRWYKFVLRCRQRFTMVRDSWVFFRDESGYMTARKAPCSKTISRKGEPCKDTLDTDASCYRTP